MPNDPHPLPPTPPLPFLFSPLKSTLFDCPKVMSSRLKNPELESNIYISQSMRLHSSWIMITILMTKLRVAMKTANVWHQRHLVCLEKAVTIFNYLKNIHENRHWFDKSFYAVQNVSISQSKYKGNGNFYLSCVSSSIKSFACSAVIASMWLTLLRNLTP